jgi:magnesium transporter
MIEAFYLDGDVKRARIEELSTIIDKPLWVDITNLNKEEQQQIQKTFNLHPLTSEDLYKTGVRVKVEKFANYIFFVFYGITEEKGIHLFEIDLILGKNFIISSHRRHDCAHDQLKHDLENLRALFEKGSDFIFHKILDKEVDNYVPALDNFGGEIEDLEEAITKQPSPQLLNQVLEKKRRLSRIRKFMVPQREKLGLLTKSEYSFISSQALPYFRDVHDHSIRILDTLDNYREALANTFDLYMSSLSNSTNEVMKVLSIIATIALPLSVVSGIYGTNFISLPGAGSSFGFWAMLLLMAVISAGMIGYFKWRNWF